MVSDQKKEVAIGEDQDGYETWPEYLVIAGWQERDRTGREPNPIELAKRIVPSFTKDLDSFGLLVEKMRPKPKTE